MNALAPAVKSPSSSTASFTASSEVDPAAADARAREAAQRFDGMLHAQAAKFTAGLSPIALTMATIDWAMHLATQPAEAARLGARAMQAALTGWPEQGPVADGRYQAPVWQQWPFAPAVRAHHAAEAWWKEASSLRGMSAHHQEMTGFFARQWLDMLSPANAGLLNPEVAQRTQERLGGNLVDGMRRAADHWRREHGLPTPTDEAPSFVPGQDVAITPGQVVHRNHLVELIQYTPSTPKVHAEPIFIVPSWIMKFYILDLSPHNSMVKWLVDQGHTVFILSWRNPDASDALLDMADYIEQGVFDPLAAIARLVPGQKVHACGYCLGGTLLSIGAAALARPTQVEGADRLPELASVTLLAAETDFAEPGEMGVLIDEEQVALLEDMMAKQGFLSGPQMGGSFAFLHSRDLVWSQRLRAYWLGETDAPNDLMAWNADSTRMPAVMHSEYLRRCYLANELALGRFPVEGHAVSLGDIRAPLFVVGTEKDHVSPWTSVYKIHQLSATEITFALANGGHNAGIVSEPGHARRHYTLSTRAANGPWLSPDRWQAQAQRSDGSWWTAWQAWLVQKGDGRQVAARQPVAVPELGAAPGQYVHVRYRD